MPPYDLAGRIYIAYGSACVPSVSFFGFRQQFPGCRIKCLLLDLKYLAVSVYEVGAKKLDEGLLPIGIESFYLFI